LRVSASNPNERYSRSEVLALLLGIFLLAQSFSLLVPPFQSPDEFNHLKRAYLLSRGDVFLQSRESVTGGDVDDGLLEYMSCFKGLPFNYGAKITSRTLHACGELPFRGDRTFSALPNTAVYLPIPYIPQAIALYAGQQAHMTVSDAYYMARFLSLATSLAILACAFRVYPVPLVAVSLFVMPMAVFQLASASLDAVSFSITLLAAALFMRGAEKGRPFPVYAHLALATCLFLLATSRIVYVVLTLLPLMLYRVQRSPVFLVSAAVTLSLSLSWNLYALMAVKGATFNSELTPIEKVRHYLADPGSLADAMIGTIFNRPYWQGMWRAFAGLLGWGDTPLSSAAYGVLGASTLALTLISFRWTRAVLRDKGAMALVLGAVISLFALFSVALVSLNPYPAKVIGGIQGRYLYPIVILLSVGLCRNPTQPVARRIAFGLFALTAAVSIVSSVPRLLHRYWIATF
jgi:uncharacterized membrane protein